MPFFVYIAANTDDEELYKGFSANPYARIEAHNRGESKFTSTKKGWHLVFVQPFETKREALIFEKKIKRLNRSSLQKLIASPDNIITT
jgi:putative endonuclease